MKKSDFCFDLPEELIAQSPAADRDGSRLMVIERKTGALGHRHFYELPGLLRPGDVLVVNDSRVIPARLTGRKPTGGRVEVLVLPGERGDSPAPLRQALLKPARGVKAGMEIFFPGEGKGILRGRISETKWKMEFETGIPFLTYLEKYGQTPLPPYIKREGPGDGEDRERYQTVYARVPGSVAAPTAGLHFTEKVLADIRARGIPIISLTLHVGYGTFAPVAAEEIEDHRVEEESYEISEEAAAGINKARRVIAVGTTSVRTLEAAADEKGIIRAGAGRTDLYIHPGYRFRRVDGLITNFHLPESSLLFLVSAFAGRELIQKAYRTAVAERYRFYSYGDCSFIF